MYQDYIDVFEASKKEEKPQNTGYATPFVAGILGKPQLAAGKNSLCDLRDSCMPGISRFLFFFRASQ